MTFLEKMSLLIKLKVTKNHGITLSFETKILEKSQRGQIGSSTFLGLKATLEQKFPFRRLTSGTCPDPLVITQFYIICLICSL